jgi:hypothetical protein
MNIIINYVIIAGTCFLYSLINGNVSIGNFLIMSTIIGVISSLIHLAIFSEKKEYSTYLTTIFLTILCISILNIYIDLYTLFIFLIIPTFAYVVTHSKNQNTQIYKPNYIELILILTTLYIGRDHLETIQTTVSTSNGDYYYFTAIVESISKQTIFNCYFDTGAQLNYQMGSFAFPMIIKKFSDLTSHCSLWGVAMPFYKSIFYLLLFNTFKLNKNRSINAILLYLLFNGFTALNPLNIIKINPEGFLFLAPGNSNLGGNPGLTAGYTLALIFVTNVFNNTNSINYYFQSLIVVLIIFTKIALFLPALTLFSLTLIKLPLTIKNLLQIVLFNIAYITIYLLVYGNQGNASISIKPFIYLTEYISSFKSLSLISNKSVVTSLLTLAFILLLCIGPRIITFIIINKLKQREKEFGLFIIVTIVASTLPLLLLDINQLGNAGLILRNINFDTEQFIRSAFIFFHLYCIYIFSEYSNKSKSLYKLPIYLFSCIGLVGFIFNTLYFYNPQNPKQLEWREEIVKNVKPTTLKCIVGESTTFIGQLLVADGCGPFYYVGRTGSGGYFGSNKNNYRQQIIDSLYHSNNKQKFIKKLKEEGVTQVITTPITEKLFINIPSEIVSQESKYIYSIL